MITPVGQRTRIGPQPKDYNKDLTCEYHQGEEVINAIGVEKSDEVGIASTKIPWEPFCPETKKQRLLTPPRAREESSRSRRISRNFVRKRKKNWGSSHQPHHRRCPKPDPVVIQYATKEKVMLQTASVSTVQSSEKVPSVVIQVPAAASLKMEEEVVGNLTSGLGGITRSGRCYTPEELEKRRKEIGKTAEDPAKTKVAEDEAADFLRIIKSSEYSVVKQLSKMPSHISVLALLLASESHRKALLKVLNEAYVPEDITGPSFENMVTSILVTNQLTFSDDELPPEGRGHVKALYISVKTNDRIVSRVLIDNGSALNVCPLSTLEKLDIDPTRVRVTSMVVRAFDGTRREVLGEIDLPVEVGPQVYNINFQVLKIDSPYNLLLGRPWLHTAGAVPSSLHQKMKLIIGNQLVTILAEEPISIYNDGEIPYIDGCASEEASFHRFQPGQGLGCANQGRTAIVTLEGNKDRYGLGYTPTRKDRQIAYEARRQRAAAKLRGEKWPEKKMVIPHIRTTFPASAMFQVDEGDVDELALLFAEDLNEDLKGYRIEEETFDEDNGEEADLPDLLPHLMISRGLETLEFEMFCEHEDPESHLQRYRKKMALCHHQAISSPPLLKKEYAGPMVEGLSIHTITEEEDSTTTPPTRHCQQGEEAKMWTCVPLLQRVSSSNEITRKTSNDPHVSEIDNKTNCSLDNIDNSDEEIELPNDILEALERQDEGSKPNIEELEIVNLADEGEEPREVKIGTRCTTEQKEALIALLREFHEIFAWSYQDMPGLDTDIVVHKIPLKPECKPVKQALRRMKPEVILKIKEEVEKQLKAGFLSTVTYSDWVANIVPVPKKDGKVRMCVDYRDLNRASPKDNFPLPHIDTLVDNTATNAVFSFMDGFSGYNQIKMAEEDKSKTAFVTHWGTFVYDVMPFGLKNAGATYQRAMVTLFHDMIHHEIEVYVDDMIAKSRTAQDHLTDLRKLFQRLKKYQLRLNPNKCAFGVTSGKLLGFIVSGRGIEIDPCKVQEASMGCMLGQQDETGKKEQAIYYLSKKFTEPETRYLLVEKTCCALAWASKKLRQYMLYYTTWLVSRMDPIKYIFEKPALTGKIARMAKFPDEDVMTVDEDNHGRWKLYFDGAANAVGSGIGAVLVSPKGQQTPIAVKLGFDCTNNMTEYEACIVGLQAALEFGAYELEVFGDSLLIVSQTNGEWQARDPKLIPYQRYISRLVPKFKYITFTYTPRAHNHFADALATLASLIKLVEGDDVRPLRIETRDIPAYCVCVEECMNVEAEIDNKPWYYDIKRFIQDREYPPRATENEKKYIRRMAFQFFLSGEILYKRTHDATLLRCVDAEEANRLIQEMHAGLMGAHANGPFLASEDYESWLLLVDNGEGLHQTCPDVPQMPDVSEQQERTSPSIFHTMASPWPFSAWGMDVIGAITPKASNGHEFILVAIDYFTKWVEACSFKNVTQVAVTRFVKNNIICRYGMPEMLITDNASNLNNRMMDQLCQQFKIQHHNSAPYRPKMNGAVEAANKNVKKILSKMTETYKDWHEHLPYALCAYRTSVRTSVGATSLLSGIWDGSSTASRSGDPFFENPVTNSAGRSRMGPSTLYQRRIERAYNKKARPRTFQPGDLVLKKRNMALSDPRGKFAPSYEGPYVVKKAFSGRSNHSG
uniref:RNA-directed DNA polymerase n=1 Tax=Fagus sylvatica TaxID=28930 RepID=A0A2N9G920_FAGSY